MSVGEPSNEPRSRHPWRWFAAGLLALLLITGLVILWVKAPDLYRAKDGAAQATALTRGGILTVAAAVIAAAAAGAGLYFTARTIRLNQEALLETQRANRDAFAALQNAFFNLEYQFHECRVLPNEKVVSRECVLDYNQLCSSAPLERRFKRQVMHPNATIRRDTWPQINVSSTSVSLVRRNIILNGSLPARAVGPMRSG